MTEKICHARFLRENTAKNPLSCMCSKTNAFVFHFMHHKFTVKQFFLAILDTTMSTRWPLWGMAYLASLKTVS